jgi:hypothetical protein
MLALRPERETGSANYDVRGLRTTALSENTLGIVSVNQIVSQALEDVEESRDRIFEIDCFRTVIVLISQRDLDGTAIIKTKDDAILIMIGLLNLMADAVAQTIPKASLVVPGTPTISSHPKAA